MKLAVSLALLLVACSRDHAGQPRGQTPGAETVPVTVGVAVKKPMPVQLRAIGNVQSVSSVTVRARIGGVLARVHFKEGQDVNANELLFTIDPGPLEAELRQAQATLARSTAQLENARRDAARYARLVEQGFVAQQQYDQIRTNAVALEATVRADRAVVEHARLQVSYATIRAPIRGRTGALLVHEGDLVKANDTALVTINQMDPIDTAFTIPEQHLGDVQRYQAAGTLVVEASPAARAPAGRAASAPGPGAAAQPSAPPASAPLSRGTVTFIDNRVDPATATVQLKATFANATGALWPGEFVSVVLTLTTEPDAIVVPSQAVQTGQQGRYVFIVKADSTVEARPVAVAREVGQEAVVTQGIAPGERVVTEGHLRLFPGAKVEIRTASAR